MKKDTLNREANEFYEDVEKDFRNLISRLFFYSLEKRTSKMRLKIL